jgi:hypothetical protein
MRVAFNFYRSYYDILAELNDAEKLEFLMALFNKQFNGIEPELKGMAKFAYLSQKHSIEKQVIGYEKKTGNVLLPTEAPCQGPAKGGYQGPAIQEKEKEKEKVKGKEKGELTPTLQSVIDYFVLHGYTKESASKAFHYYDCAGWKDSKGNKVRNWKQKMQAVWFKDENKEIKPKQSNYVSFIPESENKW